MSQWGAISEPLRVISVQRFTPEGTQFGDRLYRFEAQMADEESGFCHISAAEAQRLHQLTSEWVERALENLVAISGSARLRRALTSGPGLALHSQDAVDPRRSSSQLRVGSTSAAESCEPHPKYFIGNVRTGFRWLASGGD